MMIVLLAVPLVTALAEGGPMPKEDPLPLGRTCFQVGGDYAPSIDIAADAVLLHRITRHPWFGIEDAFAKEASIWRNCGYRIGAMFNASYYPVLEMPEEYRGLADEAAQTMSNGERVFLVDRSWNVPYFVPTARYLSFLKRLVDVTLAEHIEAIIVEEPEYWVRTGWSQAFKDLWKAAYTQEWVPPDSSIENQYKASKLKRTLFVELLRSLFAYARTEAEAERRPLNIIAASHSLLNYSHWHIVSPQTALADMPELDGFIAQVWSSTARTPNMYEGRRRQRTFDTAYLEYSQMVGMFQPTGKPIWFLADPMDDVPGRTWQEYRRDYEACLLASLLRPECARYEVMPWPQRVFKVSRTHAQAPQKGRSLPAGYACSLLAVFNALSEIGSWDGVLDAGSDGIGILVSDSMMYQRGQPGPSDPDLSEFYGLALPLLKYGIPVDIVHLEHVNQADHLALVETLLLTYEGQKPPNADCHEALAAWVHDGGSLVCFGNGTDPYHHVPAWWNGQGQHRRTAYEDLFSRLGAKGDPSLGLQPVGKGFVMILADSPSTLAKDASGAQAVRQALRQTMKAQESEVRMQNYIRVERGPYVACHVFDESSSNKPLALGGLFVDLLNDNLAVVTNKEIGPNGNALLYNIDWVIEKGYPAKVLAASTRIRDEAAEEDAITFTARGPHGTNAIVKVLTPQEPDQVNVGTDTGFTQEWDAGTRILTLRFPNGAKDIELSVSW